MPGLQPVLKMKVDELFFKWLSDPATQTQLKQYLELIKSGRPVGLANGVAEDRKSPFGENNNVTSHRSHTGKKPAPISPPCSHPSTGALPSGSSSNPRVSGPSARTLRKSVSTKKVKFIQCFLQMYHTCTCCFVFPSHYRVSRRFEQRWGCTFRITLCFTVKHYNKGVTQSSFELRLCYIMSIEEGLCFYFATAVCRAVHMVLEVMQLKSKKC